MLEVIIVDGTNPGLVETARSLFLEYSDELGEDMCFQGFDEELAVLPGKYGPPDGLLLLGQVSGTPIGCVALRPISPIPHPPPHAQSNAERGSPDACEMKRLYVRPKFRGEAFGREMAEEIIAGAQRLGYKTMLLDTLARLVPAIMLYRSMGFAEREPYYDNPIQGVVYMEKSL